MEKSNTAYRVSFAKRKVIKKGGQHRSGIRQWCQKQAHLHGELPAEAVVADGIAGSDVVRLTHPLAARAQLIHEVIAGGVQIREQKIRKKNGEHPRSRV